LVHFGQNDGSLERFSQLWWNISRFQWNLWLAPGVTFFAVTLEWQIGHLTSNMVNPKLGDRTPAVTQLNRSVSHLRWNFEEQHVNFFRDYVGKTAYFAVTLEPTVSTQLGGNEGV